MLATATSPVVLTNASDLDRLHTAQRRMYDAETALHAARQTQVDHWIAAAYDRLHEAILEHALVVASMSSTR